MKDSPTIEPAAGPPDERAVARKYGVRELIFPDSDQIRALCQYLTATLGTGRSGGVPKTAVVVMLDFLQGTLNRQFITKSPTMSKEDFAHHQPDRPREARRRGAEGQAVSERVPHHHPDHRSAQEHAGAVVAVAAAAAGAVADPGGHGSAVRVRAALPRGAEARAGAVVDAEPIIHAVHHGHQWSCRC